MNRNPQYIYISGCFSCLYLSICRHPCPENRRSCFFKAAGTILSCWNEIFHHFINFLSGRLSSSQFQVEEWVNTPHYNWNTHPSSGSLVRLSRSRLGSSRMFDLRNDASIYACSGLVCIYLWIYSSGWRYVCNYMFSAATSVSPGAAYDPARLAAVYLIRVTLLGFLYIPANRMRAFYKLFDTHDTNLQKDMQI